MNNPVPLEYVTSFAQTNQALMLQLATPLLTSGEHGANFNRFAEVAQAQQDYLQRMSALWLSTMTHTAAAPIQPVKGDRRFASEDWKKSPLHDFLKQSYLINIRYVNDLIERSSVDEKNRRRLRFFARQILDALSPSNYLATNPQSLRRAMETGGDSLAAGIKNLIDDVGKGRISMTDEKAFEVGGNLAVTPGAVIFENELIQLIQYRPLTDEVSTRPLVMVPPAINKFYVFDLQPGNSFVRYAVEQGHTVFMVSWRNITADQGHLTWDDYLELGVMRAIDVAIAVTGADKANALGFCVGGTMLGCAAAVLAARGEDKIASLTFLTTMLDFSDAGEIGLLIDDASVAARDRTIGYGGVMPGQELAFVFSTLRGNDLIWPYVVGNYLEGRQPDAFDILYWNADSTNLPGPMYCWRQAARAVAGDCARSTRELVDGLERLDANPIRRANPGTRDPRQCGVFGDRASAGPLRDIAPRLRRSRSNARMTTQGDRSHDRHRYHIRCQNAGRIIQRRIHQHARA
jgi:polyhydroxyalkanoate synthase subunit PhaC